MFDTNDEKEVYLANRGGEPTLVTEITAQKILHKWIRRLHLEDWDIQFDWRVRSGDMNLANSIGCTTYDFVGHKALVQMLDPVDYPKTRFKYDYEKTLVHELLHLTFADLGDSGDDLRDKLTHHLLDSMAQALVNTEREVAGC